MGSRGIQQEDMLWFMFMAKPLVWRCQQGDCNAKPMLHSACEELCAWHVVELGDGRRACSQRLQYYEASFCCQAPLQQGGPEKTSGPQQGHMAAYEG